MEAMPSTLGGGRSNKLKERWTEGEGIQATRGGLGAGLEDSQHLRELVGKESPFSEPLHEAAGDGAKDGGTSD